jgi:hypothetical protein
MKLLKHNVNMLEKRGVKKMCTGFIGLRVVSSGTFMVIAIVTLGVSDKFRLT